MVHGFAFKCHEVKLMSLLINEKIRLRKRGLRKLSRKLTLYRLYPPKQYGLIFDVNATLKHLQHIIVWTTVEEK